jgi:hypothetical protein
VPMSLALYIQSFISSLLLVIFPLASELKDEPERLLRLYQKALKIVCFLAIFLGASLIVESKVFLMLWMGAEFAEKSSAVLVLHAITFTLLAIEVVAWQMTEGLGYPIYNCFFFVICFIISSLGMILLVNDYGNWGVALGRTFGFGALFLTSFVAEKKFFGKVHWKFWGKLLGVLAVATLLAMNVEYFLTLKIGVNWFSLIVSGMAGGVVYFLTALLLGFVTEDETALFKKIIGR